MAVAETAAAFTADPVALWTATIVLLLVYAAIALELLHRTTATLAGVGVLFVVNFLMGALSSGFRIWPGTGAEAFDAAIAHVDWNVIFLLFGMMVIVNVMTRTGVFQVLALRVYQLSKGSIWRLALLLMVMTAVLSALLDNVTTILLLTPVTIEIALVLDIDPVPVLLAEVFASNIGGAATLVGDPPNILVGSAAGLSFNQFVVTLGPVVVVCMGALAVIAWYTWRNEYTQEGPDPQVVLERLEDEYVIRDRPLLHVSLAVVGFVIVLFLLHSFLHMEVSVAALIGAAVLVPAATLLPGSDVDVVEVLEEVEWPTLVFFMMLFVLVGAVESVGFLDMIAVWLQDVSRGDLNLAIILIIWVSAIMSALVDNIPFTATMIPVVETMTQGYPGQATILWWALVLGADFGGNATLVGASANIVCAGMAERAGHEITFTRFMKRGIPVMLVTCVIATGYLLLIA